MTQWQSPAGGGSTQWNRLSWSDTLPFQKCTVWWIELAKLATTSMHRPWIPMAIAWLHSTSQVTTQVQQVDPIGGGCLGWFVESVFPQTWLGKIQWTVSKPLLWVTISWSNWLQPSLLTLRGVCSVTHQLRVPSVDRTHKHGMGPNSRFSECQQANCSHHLGGGNLDWCATEGDLPVNGEVRGWNLCSGWNALPPCNIRPFNSRSSYRRIHNAGWHWTVCSWIDFDHSFHQQLGRNSVVAIGASLVEYCWRQYGCCVSSCNANLLIKTQNCTSMSVRLKQNFWTANDPVKQRKYVVAQIILVQTV